MRASTQAGACLWKLTEEGRRRFEEEARVLSSTQLERIQQCMSQPGARPRLTVCVCGGREGVGAEDPGPRLDVQGRKHAMGGRREDSRSEMGRGEGAALGGTHPQCGTWVQGVDGETAQMPLVLLTGQQPGDIVATVSGPGTRDRVQKGLFLCWTPGCRF